MTVSPQSGSNPPREFVLSYMNLRKSIGTIGMLLPLVLIVGKWIFQGWGIQPSISGYYYTVMRDVFVGALWAIGIFLFSYRGHERQDEIASNLAGFFAIGVSLFPTTPDGSAALKELIIGAVHYLFAAAFFVTLSYICLVLFRKTDQASPGPAKLLRNKVYATCGRVMLGCIALIVVTKLPLAKTAIQSLDPVFWLESIAIVAFGFSWLVKGEALFRD